ncbi:MULTISPECIES: rod shape-determining protein MreD [Bacillales]|uniref:Rod shape-determining protein MreD n=1 Tax=Lysinibacillus louembei TaxID=1470088 RepID=A0ABZ0RVF4_9BACI|nr:MULTISPECIES: rod shape-determining protein MreD [Bacillales]MCT6923112.1 rod shape-determining protein MreD [Metasolibacillus sp.]MCT6939350.1 rod shape-determining protein MreD [Metasolibacillus sp.]WPK10803.1 rod shape-determining protein MreD [Lysinibacillus louembei]
MFIRLLIPTVAVLLFLSESMFAKFSPIMLGEQLVFLVPRFLILYLIFIAIYYNRKRAVLYGLAFGILYDVFYIDIIGLYSFLYPLLCFLAGWSVKYVHQHLVITTVLAVMLVAAMEVVLYEFFFLIDFTPMTFQTFLHSRLIPTIVANLLFLAILGWAFKYVINQRVLQRARNGA